MHTYSGLKPETTYAKLVLVIPQLTLPLYTVLSRRGGSVATSRGGCGVAARLLLLHGDGEMERGGPNIRRASGESSAPNRSPRRARCAAR